MAVMVRPVNLCKPQEPGAHTGSIGTSRQHTQEPRIGGVFYTWGKSESIRPSSLYWVLGRGEDFCVCIKSDVPAPATDAGFTVRDTPNKFSGGGGPAAGWRDIPTGLGKCGSLLWRRSSKAWRK